MPTQPVLLPPCPPNRGIQWLIRIVLTKRLRERPMPRRLARLMELWLNGSAPSTIIQQMSKSYSVSAETIERDMQRLGQLLPRSCFFEDPNKLIEQARSMARQQGNVESIVGALALAIIVKEQVGLNTAVGWLHTLVELDGCSSGSIKNHFWKVVDNLP